MSDYHATQLTGTRCAPYNCAAASGGMGVAAGSGYVDIVSADAFRAQADVSCVPGVHSNSGGLFISDVERVFARHGIEIDYGRDRNAEGLPTRWDPSTLERRLKEGDGAVVLGDYDALPRQYRASVSFLGDHSVWVHDFDDEDDTVCWHDPLRRARMRIPISAVISYWQKPTSPIRGFAGFVAIPSPEDGMDVGFEFEDSAKSGTFRSDGEAGHLYLDLATGVTHPFPAGFRNGKHGFGPVRLTGRGITGEDDPRDEGYLIGKGAAFVLKEDGTFVNDTGDKVHAMRLTKDGKDVWAGNV